MDMYSSKNLVSRELSGFLFFEINSVKSTIRCVFLWLFGNKLALMLSIA